MRKGNWFQTYTGIAFWPLDPRPEEVCIEDIAHPLSMQCRYNGHCREFYSVAQHSVLVSSILDKDAAWGLMHDAAEAYIGDMVRPIKLHMPTFRDVEALVMRAICQRFGLPIVEPRSVKQADDILLMTERRDLLASPTRPWTPRADPLADKILPWSQNEAYARFCDRFAELFPGEGE